MIMPALTTPTKMDSIACVAILLWESVRSDGLRGAKAGEDFIPVEVNANSVRVEPLLKRRPAAGEICGTDQLTLCLSTHIGI